MARWPKRYLKAVLAPYTSEYQLTECKSDSPQDIRIATQEDDELALLKHTIMSGWPSTIREVPSEIQPY